MPEIIMVAENESDARMVCALADQVLLRIGPDWLDEHILPHCRTWTAFEPGNICTRWTAISNLYKEHRLPRYRGHIDGNPQGVDTAITRKVISLALTFKNKHGREIIALILSRDLDSQIERRNGMHQAAKEAGDKLPIAIAAQYPKREAWILNGYNCQNKCEEERLETIKRRLNFDPCIEADRLRYSSNTSDPIRDPKKIIDELEIDYEREQKCWIDTSLEILRSRGERTFLKDYLDAVENNILPLLSQ